MRNAKCGFDLGRGFRVAKAGKSGDNVESQIALDLYEELEWAMGQAS